MFTAIFSRPQLLAFGLTFTAVFSAFTPAHALQPLGRFLESAKTHNFDNREAKASVLERRGEALQSQLELAPVLSATGAYTRNQYEVITRLPSKDGVSPPRTSIITPINQLDGNFKLSVPLIHVGAWLNMRAAKYGIEVERARAESTALGVQVQVVQAYYQLIAQQAVLRAAKQSLSATEDNAKYVKARFDQGLVPDLDVKRAAAEIERVNQTIADAEYGVAVALRSLATLTGLEPEAGTQELLDDLHEEAPLESLLDEDASGLPSVRTSMAEKKLAVANLRSAKAVLAPILEASATERLTNATGFLGKNFIGSAGFTATWLFDPSAFGQFAARKQAVRRASIREERARRGVGDDIYNAWHQVRAALAKSKSARAQVEASEAAFTRAQERYRAGVALLLDITQAERDLFSAQITKIQSDGDLVLARNLLRLRSGKSLANPRDEGFQQDLRSPQQGKGTGPESVPAPDDRSASQVTSGAEQPSGAKAAVP